MNILLMSGNLGMDADIRKVGDKDYISFSIANNVGTKDDPKTEWVGIMYKSNSEKLLSYLKKGAKVFVMGTPRESIYQDKTGVNRISKTIWTDRLEILCFAKDFEKADNNINDIGKVPQNENLQQIAFTPPTGEGLPF